MSRFSIISLRTALILLVLLAILPPLMLALYSSIQERRLFTTELEEDTLRLTRLAAANQEHIVEGARQLLIALSQLREVREPDTAACDSLFNGLINQYTYYAVFGATNLDGKVICGSSARAEECNVGNRSWFQDALETVDFAVGGYEVGCASEKPTITVAYPILDDVSGVGGVVFAGLDLGQINPFSEQIELPQKGILVVFDRDGVILAHYPEPDKWVGKALANPGLVTTILSRGEGFTQLTDADGVERIYAFTPLHSLVETGVYVSISIPVDVALAEVRKLQNRNMLGLLLAGVVALSAAWFVGHLFILRRVNVLLGATRRLAGGDLTTRSGFSRGRNELSRLATAFDQMAESLEQRTYQLRQAEEKYRSLVEQIPAITYTSDIDDEGGILYISPQIEKLTGFTAAELVADRTLWRRQVHPDDRGRMSKEIAGCNANMQPLSTAYRFLTREGHVLWLRDEAVIERDCSGRARSRQGLITDITERQMAEEKLRSYQQQLRSLASQLSLAEERERRRIATDLHDRIGQKLAISKIKLDVVQGSPLSKEFSGQLDQIHELLEQAIEDVRSLIYTISSPILYELGFEEAVEWLTEQFERQHDIPCDYESDDAPKPLDNDIRVTLFQAVNELLVNVAKHSKATRAKVSISRHGTTIRIRVEDNGVGFDFAKAGLHYCKAGGFGLFSIRERLSPLGGELEIDSQPGKGTRMTLVAPLRNDQDRT